MATYYRCEFCDLIQMDEKSFLNNLEERKHYLNHKNDKEDPGYTNFLLKCLEPTIKFLAPGMTGLDFGCGPFPMLAKLMGERGFPMDYYDPYFFPEKRKLRDKYDFVTATEVVEHFNEPLLSWKELVSMVRKGGVLSVMTSLHSFGSEQNEGETSSFEKWTYRFDTTHVCFYSAKTMEHLANSLEMRVLESSEHLFIFQK